MQDELGDSEAELVRTDGLRVSRQVKKGHVELYPNSTWLPVPPAEVHPFAMRSVVGITDFSTYGRLHLSRVLMIASYETFGMRQSSKLA